MHEKHEMSCIKCGRKTNSGFFYENWKLSLSLDQYSNVLYSLFLLNPKLRAIKIYWN